MLLRPGSRAQRYWFLAMGLAFTFQALMYRTPLRYHLPVISPSLEEFGMIAVLSSTLQSVHWSFRDIASPSSTGPLPIAMHMMAAGVESRNLGILIRYVLAAIDLSFLSHFCLGQWIAERYHRSTPENFWAEFYDQERNQRMSYTTINNLLREQRKEANNLIAKQQQEQFGADFSQVYQARGKPMVRASAIAKRAMNGKHCQLWYLFTSYLTSICTYPLHQECDYRSTVQIINLFLYNTSGTIASSSTHLAC